MSPLDRAVLAEKVAAVERHLTRVRDKLPRTFMFHQGGTMSEYGIGPGSSPALRSPGHGIWERRRGWQEYSFTFMFLPL